MNHLYADDMHIYFEMEGRSMKKAIATILVAALMAAALCCGFAEEALQEVNGGAGESGRIEGPGYDTPEEAATAYIEALQKNDLNGMLSTFAVETYVEHFDLAYLVERMRSYVITMGYVPGISDYAAALNLEYRRSQISQSIREQYLTLMGSACVDGKPILNREQLDGDAFLANIFAPEDRSFLSQIRFEGEFLAMDALRDDFDGEEIASAIETCRADAGADEAECLVAKLQIAGDPYVLFINAVRYGDSWYNLSLGGIPSYRMGLDTFTGGISPYPIPEQAD